MHIFQKNHKTTLILVLEDVDGQFEIPLLSFYDTASCLGCPTYGEVGEVIWLIGPLDKIVLQSKFEILFHFTSMAKLFMGSKWLPAHAFIIMWTSCKV